MSSSSSRVHPFCQISQSQKGGEVDSNNDVEYNFLSNGIICEITCLPLHHFDTGNYTRHSRVS
jgi:hypothetical protein